MDIENLHARLCTQASSILEATDAVLPWTSILQPVLRDIGQISSVSTRDTVSADLATFSGLPFAGITLQLLETFPDEVMSDCIDPFIRNFSELISKSPAASQFEGESCLAVNVTRQGWQLPSGLQLPGIGARPQGVYVMHMGVNAQQRAHVHGIPSQDGNFVPNSGARTLVGIFGASRSTISTPMGVHMIPRGAVMLIHFMQEGGIPTAHRFANFGAPMESGNLFFCFHGIDFGPDGDVCGSDTMRQRTYLLDQELFEPSKCF